MESTRTWDGTGFEFEFCPGSVGYISRVHGAYDYLGPFGFLWVHNTYGLIQKLYLKKNCVLNSSLKPETLREFML